MKEYMKDRKKFVLCTMLIIWMIGMCLDTRKADSSIAMSAMSSEKAVMYDTSLDVRADETCSEETMGAQTSTLRYCEIRRTSLSIKGLLREFIAQFNIPVLCVIKKQNTVTFISYNLVLETSQFYILDYIQDQDGLKG